MELFLYAMLADDGTTSKPLFSKYMFLFYKIGVISIAFHCIYIYMKTFTLEYMLFKVIMKVMNYDLLTSHLGARLSNNHCSSSNIIIVRKTIIYLFFDIIFYC